MLRFANEYVDRSASVSKLDTALSSLSQLEGYVTDNRPLYLSQRISPFLSGVIEFDKI